MFFVHFNNLMFSLFYYSRTKFDFISLHEVKSLRILNRYLRNKMDINTQITVGKIINGGLGELLRRHCSFAVHNAVLQ